ncbi:MAG: LptE family protein [Cytophagales bacterium]
MNLKTKFAYALSFGFLLLTVNGCGVYSFTGTNISPDVKTISVATFYNESGNGPASISQTFSEGLRDFYQSNTNLELVNSNGDLQIEGRISYYAVDNVAPTGDELAALNRLRIKVRINYINTKDETQSFENKQFTFFEDFDQQTTLQSVEDELIENISEQIFLDIFTETVASW